MRIKGVDFPQPLLLAQKKGRLVIFAGAGVSKASPSNLPGFPKLAEEVGKGALPKRKGEPDDRYLGRLENCGVQVHQRAFEILSNPASKPTALHYDLIRLFPKASDVRLVTTNFDTHFTTAVREVFKNGVDREPEIFCGPALPLGQEFNGIVLPHGSVTKGPRSLVLTDSDFGRAYLTEGWARRFLQAMFSTYTVLFVGYSHNDTVMNYLARGLPPGSRELHRYALTREGETEHWEFLGVVPIAYPLGAGECRHSALGDAVSAWAARARRGALDQEQRIKEIVTGPPPLDPETDDEMTEALREIHGVRFFTRHASSPEWLRWAESKGAFKLLFEPGRTEEPTAREIAQWFAQMFVLQHPEDTLEVVQRLGPRLNETFWLAIADALNRCGNQVDPEVLARWLSVLLGRYVPENGWEYLNWIFSRLSYPEDRFAAILLFEELTRPHLRLEPVFAFFTGASGGSKTDVRVTIRGCSYWLKERWKDYFTPQLKDFAVVLEPILTSHLQGAHYALRSCGRANEHSDHITLIRSAIEPHEQDKLEHDTDILIDAARDVLEWLLENSRGHAAALIEAWSISDVPLLRRLAIHGVTNSNQLTADDKLAWLLERDWLYALGLKHEVFHLLGVSYPVASGKTRAEVLKRVGRGHQGDIRQHLSDEENEYAIFNLLDWLSKAAPDCEMVATQLQEIQTRNPNFKPRDYPDLDHWFRSGWGGPSSPLSPEELLGKEPDEILDMLLTYKGDAFNGPGREGLWYATEAAVAKSFEWGMRLAGHLAKREEWQTGLWSHVLDGLRKHASEEQACATILNFFREKTDLRALASGIADFLRRTIDERGLGLPISCLSLAESVADELWDMIHTENEQEPSEQMDWLTIAINDLAGKIIEFWIRALWQRRTANKEEQERMPPAFRDRFERVLDGETYAAQLGRVILARQIPFFISLDINWTRTKIFPILDWCINEKRAEQAWVGFLYNPRFSRELADDTIPLVEKTFPYMGRLPDARREVFCGVVANAAVFVLDDPVEQGWWRGFFSHAESKERGWLANQIGHILRDLTEQQKEELWRRWLGRYWTERTQGIPFLLSEDEEEMAHMLEWGLHLRPVFAEVVERICDSPMPTLRQGFFCHQLADTDLPQEYPSAVAKLLWHLLKNPQQPFLLCDVFHTLMRKLIDARAPRRDLLLICEKLAELGCDSASELRILVESTL